MPNMFRVAKVTQNQDPAADAVDSFDLPTDPISALMIEIAPLQESSTFTTYEAFAAILDSLNDIRVFRGGLRIFEASGRDAWALARHQHHVTAMQSGQLNTDNIRRNVILPILFGRWLGDPEYAIPATRAGQLTIEIDHDIASAGYDDLQYSIEALELPGSTPRNFFRRTTINQTFGATGIQTIDLPLQGDIWGLLLWQTTAYTGAAPAPSFGRVRVLKDGVAVGYDGSDIQVAKALAAMAGMGPSRYDDHVHFADLDAGADADTEPVEVQQGADANYVYLPFDFRRDGMYAITGRGAGRFQLEANAETADAVRVIPVEALPTSLFSGV